MKRDIKKWITIGAIAMLVIVLGFNVYEVIKLAENLAYAPEVVTIQGVIDYETAVAVEPDYIEIETEPVTADIVKEFIEISEPAKAAEPIEPTEAAVETIELDAPEAAEPTEPAEVIEDEPIYLGGFLLTAYCSCSKCCGSYANNRPVDEDGNEIVYGSTGKPLRSNYSIAVDPTVIPYGAIVIIGGHEYEATDSGSAVKNNHIDIYYDSHEEALDFGGGYADVYIK